VTLIASNDCGSDTLTRTVEVIVISTELPNFLKNMAVYPNPGHGQLTLEMSGQPRREVQVELYDMLGRRLFDQEVDFSSGQLNTRFDWSDLPAGTYVLQVQSGVEVVRWKLIFNK
jgi:hypothetical protein